MENKQSASSFIASSSKSAPKDIHSSDSEDDSVQSDADSALHPTSTKKLCTSSVQRRSKSHPLSGKRSYNPKWEKQFTWLEYSEDHQGAFCKICN